MIQTTAHRIFIHCSFSLRQMENNGIDLKKVEAETAEKIAAVHLEKVNIVNAFIVQMKVRVEPGRLFFLPCATATVISPLPHLQLRAKLTMEKVHLALETVGLTAEKTKLEQDYREGTSELKSLEVRTHTHTHTHSHLTHTHAPPQTSSNFVSAKIRASGAEEAAAE